MLIPKKSKITVYSYLFKEGVMVARKEFNLNKHADVDVPNLWVLKLMQSLKSRDYVREKFSWMTFYWYLTNDGIEYLREYLNLPREIVPATLKKTRTGAPGGRPRGFGGDRRGEGAGGDGERGGGRSFPSDDKKLGGAGSDFVPRFNQGGREGGRGGGFGRGGGGEGRRPFGGDRERGGGFGDRERGGGFGDRERGGGFGRGGGDRGGRQSYRRDDGGRGSGEGGRGFGRGGGGFGDRDRGSGGGGFGGGERPPRQGGGFGRGQ